MTVILVTGATGNQGGAVVSALLNHQKLNPSSITEIRALTRNTSSAASKALSDRGITMLQGDLESDSSDGGNSSILAAMKGTDVAFLVTAFRNQNGIAGEIKQGETFITVAKAAGVKHIVFTSVSGADVAKSVPHFHSKCQIEQKIRASGIPFTFLRPTAFMENIPRAGIARFAFLTGMYSMFDDCAIFHISCRDIGEVACRALLAPTEFNGRIIDLVGHVATVEEMQDALFKAEGVRPWKGWVPKSFLLAIMPSEPKKMVVVCGLGQSRVCADSLAFVQDVLAAQGARKRG